MMHRAVFVVFKLLLFFYFLTSSVISEAKEMSLIIAVDSAIVKSFYGGSQTKVPEGKIWTFQKVFVSGDNGYNILINPSNFKKQYQSGEIIVFPLYIPEMELLDNKEMIRYLVYIDEN